MSKENFTKHRTTAEHAAGISAVGLVFLYRNVTILTLAAFSFLTCCSEGLVGGGGANTSSALYGSLFNYKEVELNGSELNARPVVFSDDGKFVVVATPPPGEMVENFGTVYTYKVEDDKSLTLVQSIKGPPDDEWRDKYSGEDPFPNGTFKSSGRYVAITGTAGSLDYELVHLYGFGEGGLTPVRTFGPYGETQGCFFLGKGRELQDVGYNRGVEIYGDTLAISWRNACVGYGKRDYYFIDLWKNVGGEWTYVTRIPNEEGVHLLSKNILWAGKGHFYDITSGGLRCDLTKQIENIELSYQIENDVHPDDDTFRVTVRVGNDETKSAIINFNTCEFKDSTDYNKVVMGFSNYLIQDSLQGFPNPGRTIYTTYTPDEILSGLLLPRTLKDPNHYSALSQSGASLAVYQNCDLNAKGDPCISRDSFLIWPKLPGVDGSSGTGADPVGPVKPFDSSGFAMKCKTLNASYQGTYNLSQADQSSYPYFISYNNGQFSSRTNLSPNLSHPYFLSIGNLNYRVTSQSSCTPNPVTLAELPLEPQKVPINSVWSYVQSRFNLGDIYCHEYKIDGSQSICLEEAFCANVETKDNANNVTSWTTNLKALEDSSSLKKPGYCN